MSQAASILPTSAPTTAGVSMGAYSALLNSAIAALQSKFSGVVAPTTFAGTPLTYQWWVDTSFTPARLKIYDGSTWPVVGYIDAVNHTFQARGMPTIPTSTADATLALADVGKRFQSGTTAGINFTIPSSTAVAMPPD